jgi:hypothetical protein
MNSLLKKMIPHAVAVMVFIVISSIYFAPVFQGYNLRQGDIRQFKGMAKELSDYRALNGEEALWTNSMFGGMPAYQISVEHSNNYLITVNKMLQLGLPGPVGLLFISMLGFYIFALCLRINPWLGMMGGLAFGFSTINVLYIGAGHVTKVNAIAYMAPALGGLILAFRGRLLVGAAVFALFFGLNLTCNHLQMTYYLTFLLGAVAVAESIRLLLAKEVVKLAKIVGALVIASLLAVLPGIGNITSTLEYSKYTTRGATDLTIKPKGENKEDRAKEGLNTDYILEYNYGKGEILSLIAPNAKGAKDDMIGNDEDAMMDVDSEFAEQVSKMNHYWGGQRMSGGAFYFGVVMFVFFLFGLIFVKDSLKWPFLVITVLALMLASKDPGGLNDFFINKFPLYNKFRDSKMILVLIQVMVPALGILFIDKLLDKKEILFGKKALLITSGALVFFGIILYAVPSLSGSFLRTEEISQFDQAVAASKEAQQTDYLNGLKQTLIETRVGIYKAEIGRTIMLIIIGCGLILLTLYTKINRVIFTLIATVFVFGDNFSVSKRYLNNDAEGVQYFSYEEAEGADFPFVSSVADLSILNREKSSVQGFDSKVSELKDKLEGSPNFENADDSRKMEEVAAFGVLNLNTDYRVLTFGNPFNETNTSYFHKSLGGYHGAKLKRYQEMIDFHIGNEIMQMNSVIGAAKNKKLREYAAVTPIAPDQAQAVFDTISLTEIELPSTLPVLNMLNTKYLILDPNKPAMKNNGANGNAWFVDKVIAVTNSNDEMSKINGMDSKHEAIVNTKEFSNVKAPSSVDSNSRITLTKYGTRVLTYQSESKSEAPAIFSEIWYPEGWNCYIDGKKSEVFRANYILRGAMVPAGKHTVEWRFEPETFAKMKTVSLLGSLALLLGGLIVLFLSLKEKTNDENEDILA